jgi:flavin-dependent dehydrogenase
MRDLFDQFLVQQAGHRGAEIKDATPVLGVTFEGDGWAVKTPTGELKARYLIAADGAEGPMAAWLGFKLPKLRPASILEVAVAPATAADCPIGFEFGLVKGGCLWNFPKQDGYSIGITNFLGGDLKHRDDSLAQYAAAFGVSEHQGQIYHHPLKLWDGNRPLHTNRAVLAGEAAAVVDPLTAEGIRPAIASGVKAAQAIDQALAGREDALANYTLTIHQDWGAEMQWAQRIAAVFFRMPGIGYRVGIQRPTATQRLGELLAGEIGYSDIAQRVIKRLSGSLISGR